MQYLRRVAPVNLTNHSGIHHMGTREDTLPSDPAPPAGTQSIRRAVALLSEIATYNQNGIRLVDLAELLGIERSTAHRILQCLVYERLLVEKQPGYRYVLGPLAYELGLSAGKRFNMADAFARSMRAIAKDTGDVVFLSVRSGHATTSIARVEGDYPVKAYTRSIGDRRPLGFGCVGTIVLAQLPDDKVRAILEHNASGLRAFGVTRPLAQLAKVQRARELGYDVHERPTHGLKAVAVPVLAASGRLLGVMSICALSSRLDEARIPFLLKVLRRYCTDVDDSAFEHPEQP